MSRDSIKGTRETKRAPFWQGGRYTKFRGGGNTENKIPLPLSSHSQSKRKTKTQIVTLSRQLNDYIDNSIQRLFFYCAEEKIGRENSVKMMGGEFRFNFNINVSENAYNEHIAAEKLIFKKRHTSKMRWDSGAPKPGSKLNEACKEFSEILIRKIHKLIYINELPYENDSFPWSINLPGPSYKNKELVISFRYIVPEKNISIKEKLSFREQIDLNFHFHLLEDSKTNTENPLDQIVGGIRKLNEHSDWVLEAARDLTSISFENVQREISDVKPTEYDVKKTKLKKFAVIKKDEFGAWCFSFQDALFPLKTNKEGKSATRLRGGGQSGKSCNTSGDSETNNGLKENKTSISAGLSTLTPPKDYHSACPYLGPSLKRTKKRQKYQKSWGHQEGQEHHEHQKRQESQERQEYQERQRSRQEHQKIQKPQEQKLSRDASKLPIKIKREKSPHSSQQNLAWRGYAQLKSILATCWAMLLTGASKKTAQFCFMAVFAYPIMARCLKNSGLLSQETDSSLSSNKNNTRHVDREMFEMLLNVMSISMFLNNPEAPEAVVMISVLLYFIYAVAGVVYPMVADVDHGAQLNEPVTLSDQHDGAFVDQQVIQTIQGKDTETEPNTGSAIPARNRFLAPMREAKQRARPSLKKGENHDSLPFKPPSCQAYSGNC